MDGRDGGCGNRFGLFVGLLGLIVVGCQASNLPRAVSQTVGIGSRPTAIGGGGPDPMWRGIGYAIPTAIAKRYVADLAETGTVRRGWIGVTVEGLSPSGAKLRGLDHTYGVNVKSVVQGGPAFKAGIRKGDVLLNIDDIEVRTANQVKARVAAVAPGESVKIKLLSNRAIRTIRVKLGERSPNGS